MEHAIKKSKEFMTVLEYAQSGLYLGKEITTPRVWQLVKDGVLRLKRKKPVFVYADKISEKKYN